MGRGLRIVIGVLAGLLLANVTRLFAEGVPLVFFGTWLLTIWLVWLITKPFAAQRS